MLTGQHVISSDGNVASRAWRAGASARSSPAKPPGFGFEDHRHAVVKLGAQLEATVAQPIESQVVGVDKAIYMMSVSGNDHLLAAGRTAVKKPRRHPFSPLTLTRRTRRNGQARYRTMTLSADEFIRRFLLHVLPKGFIASAITGCWRADNCHLKFSAVQPAIAFASL